VAASERRADDVRLAELLVVLSLGADLGTASRWEHALRQCGLAMRIGERLGLSAGERRREPSYVDWRWRVTPEADGARVTVEWTGHPKTSWRRLLLARMRRTQLHREVRASLDAVASRITPGTGRQDRGTARSSGQWSRCPPAVPGPSLDFARA
jgi:hypothetical protein